MKDSIEFLNSLKDKLNNAPGNGTAEPRFWVIRDYKSHVGDPDYHDVLDTYVTIPDAGESHELGQYLESLAEDDFQELQHDFDYGPLTMEKLKEAYYDIEDDEQAALEFIQQYVDEEAKLVYTFEECYTVPNTFFLTEAEAKDYLERFGYNHGSKAHVYGTMAYRSFDFEQLLLVIKNTDWASLK